MAGAVIDFDLIVNGKKWNPTATARRRRTAHCQNQYKKYS